MVLANQIDLQECNHTFMNITAKHTLPVSSPTKPAPSPSNTTSQHPDPREAHPSCDNCSARVTALAPQASSAHSPRMLLLWTFSVYYSCHPSSCAPAPIGFTALRPCDAWSLACPLPDVWCQYSRALFAVWRCGVCIQLFPCPVNSSVLSSQVLEVAVLGLGCGRGGSTRRTKCASVFGMG